MLVLAPIAVQFTRRFLAANAAQKQPHNDDLARLTKNAIGKKINTLASNAMKEY